jgi:streptogramin lyase
VDEETLETEDHPVGLCGYGLAIDSEGRVWNGGSLCIRRFDPRDDSVVTVNIGGAKCPECTMLRGIAVGRETSGGHVWAADSSGYLIKIEESSATFMEAMKVGTPDMIGVAIDFEGNVWTVSQGADSAHKLDPVTNDFVDVPIGKEPYTYSDMTGVQLENVMAPI